MNIIDMRKDPLDQDDQGYTMLGTCSNCLSQANVIYSQGVEKRTQLRCPNCGGLHKFTLAPAPMTPVVEDLKCICDGEFIEVGENKIMCGTCNDAKVKIINHVSKLEADMEGMLKTLQYAYRKHCMGDESIGWNELDGMLLDTLCNAMGSEKQIEWAAGIKKELDK